MKLKNLFKNLKIKQNKECPVCGTSLRKKKKIAQLINLPKYPITEFYKKKNEKLISDSLKDQIVMFCKDCDHMFLKNILDVREIYANYITSSHSSRGAIMCLENFHHFIEGNVKKITNYNLIDIGGNDSSFLNMFKNHLSKKINIDPNASAKNKKIIVKKMFLENINFKEFKNFEKKNIYVSSHTLEHLENPKKLLVNLSKNLRDDDIIFLQFPSLEKLIEHGRFDQICHQHINYFSLFSINKLLNKLKLKILDYEFDTSHFGTLRLKIKKGNFTKTFKKQNLFESSKKSYSIFNEYYSNLQKSIKKLFKNGQGYGAGLMVPILAYHLPIINELNFIIDENKEKLNKRFSNLNPLIKDLKDLDLNKPVLITSVSTKEAGRNIFNKLSNLGIKDICLPSTVI